MSEENITSGSVEDITGAETAAQPTTKGLTERIVDKLRQSKLRGGVESRWRREIAIGLRKMELGPVSLEARDSTAQSMFGGSIVDATGNLIRHTTAHDLTQGVIGTSEKDLNIVMIPITEQQQLSVKTEEVLHEAVLAYERIAKDREEIEQLKTETRAMLARLRAA